MPSVRIRFSATLFQENSSNRSPRRITIQPDVFLILLSFCSLFSHLSSLLVTMKHPWEKKWGCFLSIMARVGRARLSERWERFEPSGTVGKPWPRCFRLWLEMSSELVWTVITIDTRVCRLSFARQVSFENLRCIVITCTCIIFFMIKTRLTGFIV